MTRIFTDGAEFGDLLAWNDYTGSASSAKARTGNYSYLTGTNGYFQKNVSALAEFYVRFGVWCTGTQTLFSWLSAGATVLGSVRITATGLLTAYVSTGLVATGTHPLDLSEWNLVEIHVLINDAGTIETIVNGVSDLDYNGDTKPGSDASAGSVKFGGSTGVYYDDLAIDDAAWIGDGHIELLTPVTGGTYQWTGSDGDSVDNYALVDDIPATGDDYVKDSTAGHQDIYSLSDFTGTGKIITRVWPECRAKDNDATSGQIKLGMKTESTHLGSAITLSGNYARIVGDEELTNPHDSSAWEDADLDSIQFVVECE